jgi:hypothetical protein
MGIMGGMVLPDALRILPLFPVIPIILAGRPVKGVSP